MDKIIPVALICDNDYAMPTAVAIASLRQNKDPETRYVVYVVTPDLDESNSLRLNELAGDGLEIRIVRAGIEKYRGIHQDTPGAIRVASSAALLKFDLPNLLAEYDKAFYLDGDLIVRADLSKLFATDLEGVYAAVVSDTGQIYFKHETVRQVRNYFNSGVMLFNLKLCREHGMADMLFETKKRLANMNLMDQNVFNVAFDGKVKYLPIVYNFLYLNLLRAQGKYSIDDINRLFGAAYANLEQILAEAKVVHFSSKDKPWKFEDVPLADEWYRYYLASPYKSIPLVRSRLNASAEGAPSDPGPVPSVSVVVPVYNVEPYLRKCMDSLVHQTRTDIEIICVNDGSTDGSGAILKEYAEKDSRVKVVKQENAGQSTARNRGIRMARGEFLYFMDSDDYIDLNAMSVLYEHASKDSLDVLYFDGDAIFEDVGLETKHAYYASYYKRKKEYSSVVPGNMLYLQMKSNWDYKVSPCLQLIRRNYLVGVNLKFYEGVLQEDNLFSFLCIIQAARAKHIAQTYFHRRVRPGSTMTGKIGVRHFWGIYVACREMISYLIEHSQEPDVTKTAISDIMSLYRSLARIYSGLLSEEKLTVIRDMSTDSTLNVVLSKFISLLVKQGVDLYGPEINEWKKKLVCQRDEFNKQLNNDFKADKSKSAVLHGSPLMGVNCRLKRIIKWIVPTPLRVYEWGTERILQSVGETRKRGLQALANAQHQVKTLALEVKEQKNRLEILLSHVHAANTAINKFNTTLLTVAKKQAELSIEAAQSSRELRAKAKQNETKLAESILYNNDYERKVIHSFYDIREQKDYTQKFMDLVSGMDAESMGAVARILQRQLLIKGTEGKEVDLFSRAEQAEIVDMRADFKSNIFKVDENLFCYRNYLLPICHFESGVFRDRLGLAHVENIESVRSKDIVDVGGYVGDSALILAPLTQKHTYVFEAISQNYELLLKTIEMNRLQNIVPEKLALGGHEGRVTMNASNACSSVLMPETQVTHQESVCVVTLDKYVQEHALSVGLIKVDIEGYEQEFMKGAKATIQSQRPILLLSIYHNANDFFHIKPMIESWNLGYRFKIHKPVDNSISREVLLIAEVI